MKKGKRNSIKTSGAAVLRENRAEKSVRTIYFFQGFEQLRPFVLYALPGLLLQLPQQRCDCETQREMKSSTSQARSINNDVSISTHKIIKKFIRQIPITAVNFV